MVILAGRYADIDGRPPILTAIDEREAARLRDLARGRDVLEIGSAYGFSAILMGTVAGHVTTVDLHAGENPGSLEQLGRNIVAYGLAAQISPIVADSRYALPELERGRRRFGLVFVDGDHSREIARHDADHGWRLLRRGGWLCCHDYGQASGSPGVAEALDGLWPDGPDELVGTLWIKRKKARG